ncbi:acylneuraminate cytidylyltransferase family protein [Thalassospira sp.]|uniref:acylneuraminate cytidylyltransferase family protein n=1 Tax=Thalassospira sp. TaxID=1912094 RepID=UPI001B2078C3|nr:acylneuraminate cytidylyltransferase family protein [Thalassospira sp.]MBO6805955.1 acylneuraminate cytidylyltransferase family protein [Thalassospira sp.]
MTVIAVIPARSGSKGVPNKNKLVVAGKPLIGHIVTAARSVKGIDSIILSTEDPELAEIGEKYGAEVLFKRPPSLALDHVSIVEVLVHAVAELSKLNKNFDAILSLQPTAPLLSTRSIQKAVDLWFATKCDSVFTLREVVHNHPYRIQQLDSENCVAPLIPGGEKYLQRQDLPTFYSNSGGLYLRRRELLENWNGNDFCLGKIRKGIPVSEEEAVNIDTMLDLEIFRAIAERGMALS